MSEEVRPVQPGDQEGQASFQRAEGARPAEDQSAEETQPGQAGQEATAGTTEAQPVQPGAEESVQEPGAEQGAGGDGQ